MNELDQRIEHYGQMWDEITSRPRADIMEQEQQAGRGLKARFLGGIAIAAVALASFTAFRGGENQAEALVFTTSSIEHEQGKTNDKFISATTTTTEATTTTTDLLTQNEPTDLTLSRAEKAKIKNDVKALSDEDIALTYWNKFTGSGREVGKFEITAENPEVSKENLYTDIRINPATLAYWSTCLDSEVPSYQNCAEKTDEDGAYVLDEAGKVLLEEINVMPIRDKAELAEQTIAILEKMKFNGIDIHNGDYMTMRAIIDKDGKIIGFEQSTNNRVNDPRLNFSYVDKDGNVQVIVIRACSQITQDTPPEEETPPTTATPTTTTTTVPKTTVPVVTTTTAPTTTTSTTTTAPSSSTTTTPSTSTTTTQVTTTTKPTSTTTTAPTTSSTSSTTSTTVERTTIPPKKDDGALPPAEVPADQDHGTPDVPGQGPAGQKPNDDGYIPTETPPSSQAPDTTKVPAPSTTANTVQATEGTAPASTNPPVTAPNNPTPIDPETGPLPNPGGLLMIPVGGTIAAVRRRKSGLLVPTHEEFMKGNR